MAPVIPILGIAHIFKCVHIKVAIHRARTLGNPQINPAPKKLRSVPVSLLQALDVEYCPEEEEGIAATAGAKA